MLQTQKALASMGVGALVAGTLFAGTLVGAPAAQAAAGGPLILMGIDAEDGGPGGHGPTANYAQVVTSMLGGVTNGGSGILVLGANGYYVTSFWTAISSVTGTPVTFVGSATGTDVSTAPFSGYAMIVVSSDHYNTYQGLTDAQNDALTARKADFANHVNNGGALLGFSSTAWRGSSVPYGYLGDLGSFTFASNFYDDITPTSAGSAVGVTDSLDVCCWHDEYVTFPSFLKVLATNPATGRAAAVGGINVVVSDIQLAPAFQSAATGASQTVTATVMENNVPVAGAQVTFTAVSGPNAGLLGTGVTDGNGLATLVYSSATPGADSIEASFVDSTARTQTSNRVLVEWEEGNQPPTVSAGGVYQGDEGAPLTLTGTVNDPDGDPVTLQWTYMVSAGVDTGANCTFADPTAATTTFSCTDDGQYHVKLTASDNHNSSSDSVAVSILENVAPVIGAIQGPVAPVAIGTAVNLTAPVTDAGTNDTHNYTVKWGDSTTSAGSLSSGTYSGSHIYTAAGIYTVELTVTDDDGAADSGLYQYVVVYDPAAGFVTGGGWLNSPAGAYPTDPTMSGKANFGFVSKYKKGATVPDGQTQFQFSAAEFNFHSTAYEWLVIAGSKAQYKGSGTVNGSGDYGFILTANDGQVTGGGGVDRLRMKVWDKVTGSVIYDNQMGASDDSAASTAIENGSIVIHAKK